MRKSLSLVARGRVALQPGFFIILSELSPEGRAALKQVAGEYVAGRLKVAEQKKN